VPDPWKEAKTLPELGACLAAWWRRELYDMTTALSRCHTEISPQGEAASVLTQVCEKGHLLVYTGSAGLSVSKWKLVTKAEVQAFVPAASILHVKRALQGREGIHFSAHAPGSRSKRSSYPIELQDGKDHGWGDYVFGPKEIPEDFGGLHPDMIELLKGCWQVFVVDTQWNRNDHLWPILKRLT